MKRIRIMTAALLLLATVLSLTSCFYIKGTLPNLDWLTAAPSDETDEPWETEELTATPESGELISNELDGMTEREKVEFLASEIGKFTYTERYERTRTELSVVSCEASEPEVNETLSTIRRINEKNVGRDTYVRHSHVASKEKGRSYGEDFYFTYKQTDGYCDGYMYTSFVPHKSSPYSSVSLKSPVSLADYERYLSECPDGFPVFELDKEYAGAAVSVVPFITGTKWIISYDFKNEIPDAIEHRLFCLTRNYVNRFLPQSVTVDVTVDILTHAVEGMHLKATCRTDKDSGEELLLTLDINCGISYTADVNVSYTPEDFGSFTLCDDLRYAFYSARELDRLCFSYGNNSFDVKDTTKITKNGIFQSEAIYEDTVSYGIKNGYFVFLVDGRVKYYNSDGHYVNADRTAKFNGRDYYEIIEGDRTAEEPLDELGARGYVVSVFNNACFTADEIKSVKISKRDGKETVVELELFIYENRDYVYEYLEFGKDESELVKESLILKITFDEGDKMKNFTYILSGEYKYDGATYRFSQITEIYGIKEADLTRISVFTHDSEL